ncbi:GNAT family N-acetyltransferase [Yersinia enterocolitica]|nr:GNAT family N-acetyltransferase [Yersinia enterocolitica]
MKELISKEEGSVWFIFIEGKQKPVGWCSVIFEGPLTHDANSAHILGIIVIDTYQGKGIGRLIIQWILQTINCSHFTAAIQPSNIISQKLFALSEFVNQGSIENTVWDLWELSTNKVMLE